MADYFLHGCEVAEVVDAPETAPVDEGTRLAPPVVVAALLGTIVLVGAAVATRLGGDPRPSD